MQLPVPPLSGKCPDVSLNAWLCLCRDKQYSTHCLRALGRHTHRPLAPVGDGTGLVIQRTNYHTWSSSPIMYQRLVDLLLEILSRTLVSLTLLC